MGTCSWGLPMAVLLCMMYSCRDYVGATGQAHNTQHKEQRAMEGVMPRDSRSTAGVLATYSCTVDKPSCQLEDIRCSTDSDCYDTFPNLAMAIGMGKIYPQPTAPVCRMNLEEEKGRCSCKDNQCISYSKKFGSNVVFFYCGPCGFVGSQCISNVNCTHEQSQCRGSFCRCKKEGEFYEVSYCKIPYVGYETALQIVIIVCIVLAACVLLATIYNASSSGSNSEVLPSFVCAQGSSRILKNLLTLICPQPMMMWLDPCPHTKMPFEYHLWIQMNSREERRRRMEETVTQGG